MYVLGTNDDALDLGRSVTWLQLQRKIESIVHQDAKARVAGLPYLIPDPTVLPAVKSRVIRAFKLKPKFPRIRIRTTRPTCTNTNTVVLEEAPRSIIVSRLLRVAPLVHHKDYQFHYNTNNVRLFVSVESSRQINHLSGFCEESEIGGGPPLPGGSAAGQLCLPPHACEASDVRNYQIVKMQVSQASASGGGDQHRDFRAQIMYRRRVPFPPRRCCEAENTGVSSRTPRHGTGTMPSKLVLNCSLWFRLRRG
ncbi:hypothetical protein C8R46DRAFT_1037200 [Mycena filopes]|nr:hypothetical protein C8R46DRAFT_1037200 [Mycena filopes]